MPNVEVVAACDPAIERAEKSAPRAYTDAREMFDQGGFDILDVATRPESHLSLVKLAAEFGIPVIVQKPLAPSMEEAVRIEDIAIEGRIPCMVHENWRWQPWYRYIKQQIDAGAVGAPTTYRFEVRQADGLGPNPFPNQPYFREMPRLLVFETLVHHIDTARFLFGAIETVSATLSRRNPVLSGEDAAILVLRHESGVTGVIDGNRYIDPDPPGPAMGEAVFEGEQGRLRVNAQGVVSAHSEVVWRPAGEIGYKGDSVRATQAHFLQCLETATDFETETGEYLKTFAAMEAAYESDRRGLPVCPDNLIP